jgi:hypothetical protein
MIYFHGALKKRSYFEGWYFKNQYKTGIISFIPAFHIDEEGKKSVSIQVITNTISEQITYPVNEFAILRRKSGIRIGENIFSNKGILLNIKSERLTVTGKLIFSTFTMPNYDIMGPFRYIPFMQCRHSVYSISHNVNGCLSINGMTVSFNKGLGYVEGDRGVEFPRSYFWTQCGWREKGNNSVMISVADIPYGRITFKGCIGIVYYGGKEYRFATYLGAKIRKYSKRELWVQQGRYELQVTLIDKNPQDLLAPIKGNMIRTVRESIDCRIHYRFIVDGNVIFNFIGRGSCERE